MCFGLGHLDAADEVGVGNCFTLRDGLFGDKIDCVGAFDAFGGDTGSTSILCQAEKVVGGGNFSSRFLRA